MRKSVICVLVLVLLSLFQIGAADASDFWCSFVYYDLVTGTFDAYVMKFDENGVITAGPKLVRPNSVIAALSMDSHGRLMLFTMEFLAVPPLPIGRQLLDANTLAPITSFKKTGIMVNGSFPVSLQVTQDGPRFFLVTETDDESAFGFGLTSSGGWDGSKWRVNPRVADLITSNVGVSPDGGMSWSVVLNNSVPSSKIFLQGLKSNGLPIGDPNVGANGIYVFSVDMSNKLPNGRRFVAVRDHAPPFNMITQQVNGTTGDRIGKPHLLNNLYNNGWVQSVVLEHQGNFLLYNWADPGCGGYDSLAFQLLDAQGNASGNPFNIIDCTNMAHAGLVTTIDLLQQ